MNNKDNKSNEFEVLRRIENNSKSSQRDLAEKLGFSLGKLNYCLKALRKKGLIKIKNFSKNKNKLNYAYFLTPKGILHKTKMGYFFMKQKISEYEELKKELEIKKKNNVFL